MQLAEKLVIGAEDECEVEVASLAQLVEDLVEIVLGDEEHGMLLTWLHLQGLFLQLGEVALDCEGAVLELARLCL